jgi:hypothetical protein
MRGAAYLSFETHQGVQLKRIEKGNIKYQRCQKALKENSKGTFFSKDPLIAQYFDRLELVEAFKIENSSLLRHFEARLRKSGKESFLKGLFVPVKKRKIVEHALFGFQRMNDLPTIKSAYRNNYLRIP